MGKTMDNVKGYMISEGPAVVSSMVASVGGAEIITRLSGNDYLGTVGSVAIGMAAFLATKKRMYSWLHKNGRWQSEHSIDHVIKDNGKSLLEAQVIDTLIRVTSQLALQVNYNWDPWAAALVSGVGAGTVSTGFRWVRDIGRYHGREREKEEKNDFIYFG